MGFKKPSLDVTGFVDKPGWYHVFITGAKDGIEAGSYTKLQLHTTVLASTAGNDQVKRHLRLEITNPDLGQKDGGEFLFGLQCRLAVATGCFAVVTNEAGDLQYANVADVPEGQEIERLEFFGPEHEADPDNVAANIVGKQMMVKIKERNWEKDGKKGTAYELDGANIYHVEDPDAAAYPKDGAAIAQGGYKLVQAAASSGNAAANGNGTKPSPAKPAAAANGAANPGTSAKATGNGNAAKPAANAASPASKPAAGKPVAAASNFDEL